MRFPSSTGLGEYVISVDARGVLAGWKFVPYPTGRFTLPNDIYMTTFAVPPPTDDDYPKAATAPLLSDDVMFSDISPANKYAHGVVCSWVRDWYEAKIASGELMVVKAVRLTEDGECPSCGSYQDMPHNAAGESMVAPFCSNCGAKIIEG